LNYVGWGRVIDDAENFSLKREGKNNKRLRSWEIRWKADKTIQSLLMFEEYKKEEQVLSFEISIFRMILTRHAKV
jgi:hypothetical protein